MQEKPNQILLEYVVTTLPQLWFNKLRVSGSCTYSSYWGKFWGYYLTVPLFFLLLLALFDVSPLPRPEFMLVICFRTGVMGFMIFSIAGLILEGKWHCKICDERFYFLMRNVPLVALTNAQVQGVGIEVKENVCPVCDAPVEPGAKYCWRCGARSS
jgi:hypothetical protein